MKRDPYDWAVEKEPSYRRSSSPRYALNGNGTVKTEMQRRAALALRYGGPCSVCSEHECKCEMGAA
jgi:hypothetical protein